MTVQFLMTGELESQRAPSGLRRAAARVSLLVSVIAGLLAGGVAFFAWQSGMFASEVPEETSEAPVPEILDESELPILVPDAPPLPNSYDAPWIGDAGVIEALPDVRGTRPKAEATPTAADVSDRPATLPDVLVENPQPVPAPTGPPWKLAALPFELAPGSDRDASYGELVSGLIASRMNTDQFEQISRTDLDRVMRERRFQDGSEVERASELRRILGAEFLLVGEVYYEPSVYTVVGKVVDCRSGAVYSTASTQYLDAYDVRDAMQELAIDLRLAPESSRPARPDLQRPDRRVVREAPVDSPPRNPARRHEVVTGNTLLDLMNPSDAFQVRFRTKSGRTAFEEGESFSLEVDSDREGYLTLVFVNPGGAVEVVYPTSAIPSPVVGPGRSHQLTANVTAPHGVTVLRAIVTSSRLTAAEISVRGDGDLKRNTKALDFGTRAQRLGGSDSGVEYMDRRFGRTGWSTAGLSITTSEQRERARVRRDALSPDHRDTAVLEEVARRWRSAVGQTSALGAGGIGERPVEASDLIVVRRVATTKSGNDWGYRSELVPVGGGPRTKSLNDPTLGDQIEAIKRADPAVVSVIPDFQMYSFSSQPSLYEHQWALENSVAREIDTSWYRASRPDASDSFPLVAVIDSGLDLLDPRCRAFVWRNQGEIPGNGLDDDGNGHIDDVHGYDIANDDPDVTPENRGFDHGTFCASLIAAGMPGSGSEIDGIAPGARILPINAFRGDGARVSDLFRSLEYAMVNGARIVNLSLGFAEKLDQRMDPAIVANFMAHPIWAELERRGVLVVIAAGNDNQDNDELVVLPANVGRSNMISVMAIDPSGRPARQFDGRSWVPFTNFGKNTVHIAAPGALIVGYDGHGGVTIGHGTSYAAPLVTGAAALLWAKNPDWGYDTVRRALLESSRPMAGLEHRCESGGMLDVRAALLWRPEP